MVVTESSGLHRRSALLGAAASLGASSLQAPAFAAEAPQQLQVNGLPVSRINANGVWTIVDGQKINDRAVYKKDGEKFYLLINDCSEFQLGDKLSGSCDGWAKESDKKWTVDGKPAKLTVRPVKPKPTPVAATSGEAGSAAAALSASDLNAKLLGLEGKTDRELLFDGPNVLNYIRANGGQDFLANQMKLSEEDDKVATSLEDRLSKRSLPPLQRR